MTQRRVCILDTAAGEAGDKLLFRSVGGPATTDRKPTFRIEIESICDPKSIHVNRLPFDAHSLCPVAVAILTRWSSLRNLRRRPSLVAAAELPALAQSPSTIASGTASCRVLYWSIVIHLEPELLVDPLHRSLRRWSPLPRR